MTKNLLKAMSDFLIAYRHVRQNEGGFVDDPSDAGGATKWGVSLRYLRANGHLKFDMDDDGDLDVDDIFNLTETAAEEVYKDIWTHLGAWRIKQQPVATKVFDMAVNMGSKQAVRCLQRALRSNSYSVVEDGILGPRTAALVNLCGPGLLAALRSEAACVYRQIVISKPQNLKFYDGWLSRAYQ